jgi:hypothetical protein
MRDLRPDRSFLRDISSSRMGQGAAQTPQHAGSSHGPLREVEVEGSHDREVVDAAVGAWNLCLDDVARRSLPEAEVWGALRERVPGRRFIRGIPLYRVLDVGVLVRGKEVSPVIFADRTEGGRRLAAATCWLRAEPGTEGLAIGYFGASAGAAAALWAAAEPDAGVAAVVSRGGRPDFAGPRLPEVTAPTLLIVGGHNDLVLDLSQQAQGLLRCERRLEAVPGATQVCKPGALEAVAVLARDWFTDRLAPAPQSASGP